MDDGTIEDFLRLVSQVDKYGVWPAEGGPAQQTAWFWYNYWELRWMINQVHTLEAKEDGG